MSPIAYLLLCLSFIISYVSKKAEVGILFFMITGALKILSNPGGIELITEGPLQVVATGAVLYILGFVVSIPGAFLSSPRSET